VSYQSNSESGYSKYKVLDYIIMCSTATSPSSTHVAIDIEENNNQEDNDDRVKLGIGNTTKALPSLREVPLVELSLNSITYAPSTRSSGGTNSKLKQKRTTVLSNVTTSISPNTLSAWMGPSGCGKTSLVSVAAGLIDSNDLVGDSSILINGEKGTLPKRIGVVWQDDLLLSNLTVKETVRFSARLKTPKHVTDSEVEMLVDNTLSKLGLTHVQDSLIGMPGGSGKSRGISGGERKRVAVAVELVARPSILILDEPTSGLDASTAHQLMVTLKSLAELGHSIAVVIHQPRTSIFNMFDNLLLLSKGKVVYEGEPSGARQFLESCPEVGTLPAETGLADWIMDVINDDEKKDGTLPSTWKEHCIKQQQDIPQCRSGNQLTQRHIANSRRSLKFSQMERRLSSLKELEESEPKFQSSFFVQLKLLTKRALRQQRGQRLTSVAAIVTFAWTLFTCLAWGRLPDNTTYVFSRASLLFFIIIAQANGVVTSSVMIFSSERHLLSRERAKKLYGVLPYFTAMTLSDMINSVILPTVYGCVVYWVCNLRPTAAAFFSYLLTFYLTISAAQSMGLFLSVLIPNSKIALLLAPMLCLSLFILGGFYMPLNLIPPSLEWYSWISMAR